MNIQLENMSFYRQQAVTFVKVLFYLTNDLVKTGLILWYVTTWKPAIFEYCKFKKAFLSGYRAQQTNPICTYHHSVCAHGLHRQIMLGNLSKATNEATKDVSHERIAVICFVGSQLFLIEILVGSNIQKIFGYRKKICFQYPWEEVFMVGTTKVGISVLTD